MRRINYGFGSNVFLLHSAWVLVITQGDEPRVSQVISFGPFRKFDLCYELRAEPLNLRHYFSGYRFAAARAGRFGKIREWTF
jgi:hypothetical protein